MKFRIHIREQLCLLITITTFASLAILTGSVWSQVHHFMKEAREETLTVTANLKSTQISQALSLFHDSVTSITTRDLLQTYVQDYNNGNNSEENIAGIEVS